MTTGGGRIASPRLERGNGYGSCEGIHAGFDGAIACTTGEKTTSTDIDGKGIDRFIGEVVASRVAERPWGGDPNGLLQWRVLRRLPTSSWLFDE